MRRDDPSEPPDETRSFPEPPARERPYGAPLPGYDPPFRAPGEPPSRRGSSRGWMVAFFLLLLGLAAAAVIWALVLRSENGGGLEVAPTVVDFGDVDLGKRSAVQTVLLDNEGAEDLRISSIALDGEHAQDFRVSDDTTCSPTRRLEGGSSCTIGVRFRPRVREERSAVLVIRLTGQEAAIRVALRGRGVGEATVVLEATRLDLGTVLVGKARTRRVTLTNAGNAPLRIQELVIEGEGAADFRLARATDCSVEEPLPAGAACTLAVTFRPKQDGRSSATLAIVHDAEGSVSGVELRGEGRGRAELELVPGSLDFGEFEVGGSAGPKTVTVTNTGNAVFVLAVLDLAGPAAGDFTLADTSTCAVELELEGGESCTLDVVFSPGASGERTAALEVETRGGLAGRVDLAGTGSEPPAATTAETAA